MHYRYTEKRTGHAGRFRVFSYVPSGLLAAATNVAASEDSGRNAAHEDPLARPSLFFFPYFEALVDNPAPPDSMLPDGVKDVDDNANQGGTPQNLVFLR